MRSADRTNIGGTQSAFQTTQWLQMRAFAGLNSEQQKAIIEELAARYWKPVYCYLRRKGYNNEHAKDLTQGFFQEIVMGRHLIEQADETKGRFRTFLLTALDRYVISMHRQQAASKRRPAEGMTSLDDAADVTSIAAGEMRPDEAFTYAWAVELLQDVLAEVERQCAQNGKDIHWQLFRLHVLEPIISGQEPPELAELCARFGIATRVRAENMIVTVRRRFQTAMKNRVREYVASDEEIEQEIRDLMEILSR